jgi:murein DD-endopeptidase / murein LD-carboxypeptidase
MGIFANMKFLNILLIFALASCLVFSSCRSTNKTSGKKKAPKEEKITNDRHTDKAEKTRIHTLREKYASILGVPTDAIQNIALYDFIEEWNGIPYKYGGRSKQGIDCSNLTSLLYQNVYSKSVSGSCVNLYDLCNPIKTKELKEGDLVFFKIEQTKISHVGIYLHNNKFVHATTKKGVMINDLDEAYYKKYFFMAGRLKN